VKPNSEQETEIDLGRLKSFFKEAAVASKLRFHEIKNDDIEEGLEEFVLDQKIDLLIMFSPKRNLFQRIGHRSITRKMALFSHVPLFIMK
jgi:hypothetical protein